MTRKGWEETTFFVSHRRSTCNRDLFGRARVLLIRQSDRYPHCESPGPSVYSRSRDLEEGQGWRRKGMHARARGMMQISISITWIEANDIESRDLTRGIAKTRTISKVSKISGTPLYV